MDFSLARPPPHFLFTFCWRFDFLLTETVKQSIKSLLLLCATYFFSVQWQVLKEHLPCVTVSFGISGNVVSWTS